MLPLLLLLPPLVVSETILPEPSVTMVVMEPLAFMRVVVVVLLEDEEDELADDDADDDAPWLP